jgi:hypothetical protein
MTDFLRQASIVRPEALKRPISIIGAGGIGSPTALALAKMGCSKIRVYDFDIVEAHNLPNQFYCEGDLGRAKVDALADMAQLLAGVSLEGVRERIVDQRLSGVVITAVDTMESRKAIWRNGVRYNPQVPLYLDARMGAEVCTVYSIRPVDPDDVAFYDASLYSDAEAQEDPCTARAIIYNVFGAAALLANQVKKFATGEQSFREIHFDLKTLTLITK